MWLGTKQVVRIIVSEGDAYELKSHTGDYFNQRWKLEFVGRVDGLSNSKKWTPTDFDRKLSNVRNREQKQARKRQRKVK